MVSRRVTLVTLVMAVTTLSVAATMIGPTERLPVTAAFGEPVSLALFGAGLMALAARLRRPPDTD